MSLFRSLSGVFKRLTGRRPRVRAPYVPPRLTLVTPQTPPPPVGRRLDARGLQAWLSQAYEAASPAAEAPAEAAPRRASSA